MTRIWAKTGTRARVVRQRQFLSAYLFGASCVATGPSAAIVVPKSNTAAMREHLSCISATIQSGRHAVIVMGQAAWDTTKKLADFKHLTLIFLPLSAPELNPIEQVWRQLREDSLANGCFKDFDDIVDAWNLFATNIDQVKSLCHREWTIIRNIY